MAGVTTRVFELICNLKKLISFTETKKTVHLNLKAFALLVVIVCSLIPVYGAYKFLQKKMNPRESGRRFLLYLFAIFTLIFAYTFGLVFIIKYLLPGA